MQLHKDRGQALVEFLTAEDASSALSFDGSTLFGSILKIRRPKDYVEVAVRLKTLSTHPFFYLYNRTKTVNIIAIDVFDIFFFSWIEFFYYTSF